MPKCDFTKVETRQYRCSPVNLLLIFRTPFPKNTYGGRLLQVFGVLGGIEQIN